MGSIVSNFKNRAKNQAKSEIKKAAKKALKQVAKIAAKLALKALMFLLSNPIGWVILILIIIIFAFSSVDTTAKAATTVDTIYSALGFSEGTNNFVGLVEIKSDNTGSYWSFKSDIDEKIDNIIKSLRSTTGTYTIKDKELIKKMIKAELVSTLPNLGGTPDDNINNFQGIVNIQGLTYISKTEFENNINSGNDGLGNYFSVNPENANVLIANAGKSKEINLQNSVVSKYSMPFEYLLYFLMCSDEKAFIVELIDNVLKSYINITLSSSDVKVTEANTWCVKISGDGTVDASASGENSVFSNLYKKYRIRNKIYTDKLFKCLEQNSKTQKLLEMTKYLIYTATGQEIDNVTSYDFSGFTQSSIKEVSYLGGLATFKEYLHKWEGNTGVNEDGTMYRIGDDGAGHPTVGYGIDIENSGFKDRFIEAGYSTEIGGYVPVEFVDALEDEKILSNINAIKTQLSGLNLKEYQIYALTSRMYNCGQWGATGTRNGLTFEEAFLSYWDQERDNKYGADPNDDSIYEHELYNKYMKDPVMSGGEYMLGLERRRKSEWRLFMTGYYDRIDKYCSENSADDFLAAAKEIWDIVCNGNYIYDGVNSKPVPCTGGTMDCASYVTWALKEYGYTDLTWQFGTTHFLNDDIMGKYAEEIIQVEAGENPINKLQPGDILVREPRGGQSGHVTIIVEVRDNTTYGYDCGNQDNWIGNTNGDVVNTGWFLTHPGAGKIIRVKSPN